MKLMGLNKMLPIAQSKGYGVGSFSPRNTYLIKYVLMAAEEMNSPVIVQMSANEFRWFEVSAIEFAEAFYKLKDQFNIAAGLHLDHTKDINVIKEAIDAGFTSVMIDASDKELEENIKITKKVVEYAHKKGVVVEAELGRIGATDKLETDSDDEFYTIPEEAKRFVEETGVDALAVSIGTAHGVYKVKDPKVDFERLQEIRNLTNTPLVLHGGSSLPSETIKKAINIPRGGVSKINIATDLELVFQNSLGLESRILNKEVWKLEAEALEKAGMAVKQEVKKKIQESLGSANKGADFI
ncbi:fructose-bisphosphate aldolase, class II/tagatose 1,6-diphosphate aldolase GatY/KbaY [Clostridium sp. USBA 49]|uniref:class II fructose-bisphosphate aldolase n=1 Tax=Clostridium sp. USBA 49 TaxID=1881060 RepID=UPI0009997531|nr:class II fructose-bisphosphate aldolase [Clostridium sp. USBA 49]SKA85370.1 fructose-bisphosphate aldolase, class II/tagatose 1,6-diphosphate aldolase GatY/KbaY [Clostridium sp. USBA 49]